MKPFPWRRGMTAIDECGERWLIVESDGKNWAQCRPDPDDGATKGALLDAVREAWGEPGMHLAYCWVAAVNGYLWVVADHRRHVYAFADTEFGALLAAWEAAP